MGGLQAPQEYRLHSFCHGALEGVLQFAGFLYQVVQLVALRELRRRSERIPQPTVRVTRDLSHSADEERFDLGVCRSWTAGASGTVRKRAGRIAVLQGTYIGGRQAQPCTDRDGERGIYRRDIRSVQQEQDAQRRRLRPKAHAIGTHGPASITDAWGVRTKRRRASPVRFLSPQVTG